LEGINVLVNINQLSKGQIISSIRYFLNWKNGVGKW